MECTPWPCRVARIPSLREDRRPVLMRRLRVASRGRHHASLNAVDFVLRGAPSARDHLHGGHHAPLGGREEPMEAVRCVGTV